MTETPRLIPAEARLRGLARVYGINAVSINPELTGSTTKAQVLTWPDGTRTIELRPGLTWLEGTLAVLHEVAHLLRDKEMGDDDDYHVLQRLIQIFHRWDDAGRPATAYIEALSYLEGLYLTEEKVVNSLAYDLLIRHFGVRYGKEEDFEGMGFAFAHRQR